MSEKPRIGDTVGPFTWMGTQTGRLVSSTPNFEEVEKRIVAAIEAAPDDFELLVVDSPTGRLCCDTETIQLQNVPLRTEAGRRIRDALLRIEPDVTTE